MKALLEKLDGFPLALATAGAYLDQVNTTVAEYLQLYNDSWLKLHVDDPGLDSYEDRTLHSTWRISFERIQQQNELSTKLLKLWCYFDNEDLWYELLRDGDMKDLPWMQELTRDQHVFSRAIRLLCDYGLVNAVKSREHDTESAGYSMHNCVHAWVINVLNAQWDPTSAGYAVRATGRHAPISDDNDSWIKQRRLLRHADRCLQHVRRKQVPFTEMGDAFYRLGCLYDQQDKLVEAELMYDQALQSHQSVHGLSHNSSLRTTISLASLYTRHYRLAAAESLLLQAVKDSEGLLGLKHVLTLEAITDLSSVYHHQGKLREAEDMLWRALRSRQALIEQPALIGRRDIRLLLILETFHNLAEIYLEQGRLTEAEEMYLHALKAEEKGFGPKHNLTSNTIIHLAHVYLKSGRVDGAEKMYLRALTVIEEARGPEHTSTLSAVHNLGILYSTQPGRLGNAEAMLLRALEGYNKIFGPHHVQTLQTLASLSIVFMKQGRFQEAEETCLYVLRGCEKTLGSNHSKTLAIAHQLGILYGALDMPPHARAVFSRALEGYEHAEGDYEAEIRDLRKWLPKSDAHGCMFI